MKRCSKCGKLNFNTAHECECGYVFDDIIICPFCKTENFYLAKYCHNCGKSIYEYAEKQKKRKSKTIFTCTVCNEVFDITTDSEFNVFCCQKCRSIFSYEWKIAKLLISIVRKGSIIPSHIKEILQYFNCDFPVTEAELKKKYRSLILQYHPDKVSGMGIEIREISERKTKEIIDNYNTLKEWLQGTIKDDVVEPAEKNTYSERAFHKGEELKVVVEFTMYYETDIGKPHFCKLFKGDKIFFQGYSSKDKNLYIIMTKDGITGLCPSKYLAI